MSHTQKTLDEYLKQKDERRQKKKNQQLYRRRCKRKRSLISLLSMSSISSSVVDPNSILENQSTLHSLDLLQNDTRASLPQSILADFKENSDVDSDYSDVSAASGREIPVCESPPISSSNSDDDSSDDLFEELFTAEDLFDNRSLHASTTTTVGEFSMDILEFCRSSRLPENQRSHLLELFQKYLPSPNLMPTSTASLLSKFFAFHW